MKTKKRTRIAISNRKALHILLLPLFITLFAFPVNGQSVLFGFMNSDMAIPFRYLAIFISVTACFDGEKVSAPEAVL